jgi:hypothetical protein
MLNRQSVYSMSKYGAMSKIPAAEFFALQPHQDADST